MPRVLALGLDPANSTINSSIEELNSALSEMSVMAFDGEDMRSKIFITLL